MQLIELKCRNCGGGLPADSIAWEQSSVTYSVQLVKDGGQQALVKGLTDSQQALYIEQELERFLKIEDRPVRGELSR